MYLNRLAGKLILNYIRYFPVVCVTGPRQSGKTTLIRNLFPDVPYFTFEDPDTRLIFTDDPKGFLNSLPEGALFDEAQQIPEIFSYVQGIVDSPEFKGKFILSGSQNFLLLDKVTQSLAGRTGIVKLLPFSLAELESHFSLNLNDYILRGFYPRVYNDNIPPEYFYPNYIQTYIERDIANIKSITDKTAFFRFLKFCAARCGQLLNYSQLAVDCGIAVNTAKAWLSLLVSSYIVFLLPPWFSNISKQLIKSPKLYFYDTGLATWLLDIKKADQLEPHYMFGSLFENFVMSEVIKNIANIEGSFSCFFLRNKTGHEIDLLLKNDRLVCAEIKSGKTFHPEYIKNLLYYNEMIKPDDRILIYSGDLNTEFKGVKTITWRQISSLFK